MARIRTLKPDFWTDEKVVEAPIEARLFFVGMLNFADDAGNLQRSAKKLKMQIFPADTIDCEPLIQALIEVGLVVEYSVNGDKFLHIKGFSKHQKINRPSESNIPKRQDSVITPPKEEPDSVNPPEEKATDSLNDEFDLTGDSLSTHGGLTEDSLREGKGREGNNSPSVPDLPEGFLRFWKTWPASPRKADRAECLKKWKGKHLEDLADDIVAHVEGQKTCKQWLDGFEPAPLTYLNRRRWEDAADAGGDGDAPWAGAK